MSIDQNHVDICMDRGMSVATATAKHASGRTARVSMSCLLVILITSTGTIGCSEEPNLSTISTTAPPPDGIPRPAKTSRPIWYPKRVDGSFDVPQNQANPEVKQ